MMRDLILQGAPRESLAARLASLCWRPDVDCAYFGATSGGHGHYLMSRKRGRPDHDYDLEREILHALGGAIDGALCWNSAKGTSSYQRDETEGLAFRTCRGGWTAIAFWDRSVDTRGACNSAFFVRGELTFAQVVRVARHQWPKIWARFPFEVIEVDARGRPVASE